MESLFTLLADTQVIHKHLDTLEFEEAEKEQILEMVDHIFHHRLLAVVLEELEGEEKLTFVELIDSGDHLSVVEFVKTKVVNLEEKIRITAQEVHQQIIEDILRVGED